MIVDSGASERTSALPTVDFTQPPTALEPYSFGDHVTRNNFVSCVMDSFIRSRGLIDIQYAYLRYLTFHDPSLTGTLENFENQGGLGGLTSEEITTVHNAYYEIKNHKKKLAKAGEPNLPLTESVTKNVSDALSLIKNIGKQIVFEEFKMMVYDLPDDVLNLTPHEFIRWLSIDGSRFLAMGDPI